MSGIFSCVCDVKSGKDSIEHAATNTLQQVQTLRVKCIPGEHFKIHPDLCTSLS